MFTTQIDTGYLVGVIITGLCMVAFWAVGLWMWLGKWTGRWLSSWAEGLAVWLGGWALCLAGFTILAWPPLPGQYNEYRPFSGTVAATGSRFIASGVQNGGTSQRFLVKFANGQVVGCDDTRCAALRRGAQVTLLCQRDFQFNAYEGWVCNFGRYGLNGPASLPVLSGAR